MKKFKPEKETEPEPDTNDCLTWSLEREEKEIDKKRQGEFPAWKPKPKVVKIPELTPTTVEKKSQNDESFEFEIVPVEKSNLNNKNYAISPIAKENKLLSKKRSIDVKMEGIRKSTSAIPNLGKLHESGKKRRTVSGGEIKSSEYIRTSAVGSVLAMNCEDSDSDNTDEIITTSSKLNTFPPLGGLRDDLSDGENSAGSADTDEIISLSRNKVNNVKDVPNDVKQSSPIKMKEKTPKRPGKDNCVDGAKSANHISNQQKLAKPKLQEFKGTKICFSDNDEKVTPVTSPILSKSIVDRPKSRITKTVVQPKSSVTDSSDSDTDEDCKLQQKSPVKNVLKSENDKKKVENSKLVKKTSGEPISRAEKSLSADQKRLEAVKQRQLENQSQKSIIQQALKSVVSL